LNHKVCDDSVKGCAIVCSGRAKREEILCGFWDRIAEDFNFDRAVGGVKLQIHVSDHVTDTEKDKGARMVSQ
jgi:hypothetical protein